MKRKVKTFWNGNEHEEYSSVEIYPRFCKTICSAQSWCLIKINNKWFCESKGLINIDNGVPIPCWFINSDGSLKPEKVLPKEISLLKLIAAYKKLEITSII